MRRSPEPRRDDGAVTDGTAAATFHSCTGVAPRPEVTRAPRSGTGPEGPGAGPLPRSFCMRWRASRTARRVPRRCVRRYDPAVPHPPAPRRARVSAVDARAAAPGRAGFGCPTGHWMPMTDGQDSRGALPVARAEPVGTLSPSRRHAAARDAARARRPAPRPPPACWSPVPSPQPRRRRGRRRRARRRRPTVGAAGRTVQRRPRPATVLSGASTTPTLRSPAPEAARSRGQLASVRRTRRRRRVQARARTGGPSRRNSATATAVVALCRPCGGTATGAPVGDRGRSASPRGRRRTPARRQRATAPRRRHRPAAARATGVAGPARPNAARVRPGGDAPGRRRPRCVGSSDGARPSSAWASALGGGSGGVRRRRATRLVLASTADGSGTVRRRRRHPGHAVRADHARSAPVDRSASQVRPTAASGAAVASRAARTAARIRASQVGGSARRSGAARGVRRAAPAGSRPCGSPASRPRRSRTPSARSARAGSRTAAARRRCGSPGRGRAGRVV